MKKIVRTLTLVAIVSLTAAAPATAGSVRDLPIRGSTTSADSMAPPVDVPDYPDCPEGTSWRYFSEGSGNLSHLGRVDVLVTHCTVFDEETGAGSFGNGTITFTAANGDTLIIVQSGTFQLSGDSASGEFVSLVDGEWTVVGGDGRFEGASGTGSFTAVSDLLAGDSGITTAEYSGRILYDPSSRSD